MKYPEDWLPKDFISSKDIPRCKECNGVLKPDVVLFEEMLPADAWREAQSLCETADLVIVVGSSLEVYPANSLPETALRRGAHLIINTLTTTHLDAYADIVIQADLVETIPPICELVLDQ
jgi:NAD-dependent deacetylase